MRRPWSLAFAFMVATTGAAAAREGPCETIIAAFREHNASRFGAALAFYIVFTIAPTLLIAIGIAGSLFGRPAAESAIIDRIAASFGSAAGNAVEAMIRSAASPGRWHSPNPSPRRGIDQASPGPCHPPRSRRAPPYFAAERAGSIHHAGPEPCPSGPA